VRILIVLLFDGAVGRWALAAGSACGGTEIVIRPRAESSQAAGAIAAAAPDARDSAPSLALIVSVTNCTLVTLLSAAVRSTVADASAIRAGDC
jgi:hypothetical protein